MLSSNKLLGDSPPYLPLRELSSRALSVSTCNGLWIADGAIERGVSAALLAKLARGARRNNGEIGGVKAEDASNEMRPARANGLLRDRGFIVDVLGVNSAPEFYISMQMLERRHRFIFGNLGEASDDWILCYDCQLLCRTNGAARRHRS